MRIVSLHPAATEIVFALGLGEELVGVTGYCDEPFAATEIETLAHRALPTGPNHVGPPLLDLDVAALREADPDLIVTSDATRVCAVNLRELREIAAEIDEEVEVLSLDAVSIEGVLNGIQAVGAMTEAEDEAMDVVVNLRERLQAIEGLVVARRAQGFAAPRIAALEWLDPLTAGGRWIPEQARLAGGWELLGGEGERPSQTSWESLRELDPEIIVVMAAGLHLPDAVAAYTALPKPGWWGELRAVRERRVFGVDAASYFSRPGPRLVDGIEVFAEIIDRAAFDGLSPNGAFARLD